jgi:hypothetical protein
MAGAAAGAHDVYTVDVMNCAIKKRGTSAEDVRITLELPSRLTVVSATGPGYQGVQRFDAANSVAVWRISASTLAAIRR